VRRASAQRTVDIGYRYHHGEVFRTIAESHGLSVGRVQQIVAAVERRSGVRPHREWTPEDTYIETEVWRDRDDALSAEDFWWLCNALRRSRLRKGIG
jgi:hypothetical protein